MFQGPGSRGISTNRIIVSPWNANTKPTRLLPGHMALNERDEVLYYRLASNNAVLPAWLHQNRRQWRGNLTVSVSTTGNDNNATADTTLQTPFRTVEQAHYVVSQTLMGDGISAATINVGAGTFDSYYVYYNALGWTAINVVGAGQTNTTLRGNTTGIYGNPPYAGMLYITTDSVQYTFASIKIDVSNITGAGWPIAVFGAGLGVSSLGLCPGGQGMVTLKCGNVNWSHIISSQAYVKVYGAQLTIDGAGNCYAWADISASSYFACSSANLNFINTPTWGTAGLYLTYNSFANFDLTTTTGTATGTRWIANSSSLIRSSNATLLPGTVAGTNAVAFSEHVS